MGSLQQLAGFCAAVATFFLGANPLLVPVAFLCGYAVFGGHRFLYLACKTLPRDAITFSRLLYVKLTFAAMKRKQQGIHSLFRETARRYPNKTAIVMEDEQWTFTQLDNYANQVGHCFLDMGVKRGDTVALFMLNKPEYIGSWLGLTGIGVVSSLINTNLRNESLLHCITVCEAKAVMFGLEMKEAIREIKIELEDRRIQLLVLGERGQPTPTSADITGLNATILDGTLASQPTTQPDSIQSGGPTSVHDRMLYIYTSGTTGLPKPSKITHQRFFFSGFNLMTHVGMGESTVLYCPLPMYHMNGGVLAFGPMLFRGATVALRRKFSASKFWDDCIKYRCNTTVYIGEICRYLLAQPPKATDTQHGINVAVGNGLKKILWEKFQERFKIARISEFYGATEANCYTCNAFGVTGAVGYNSIIVPWFYPVFLIKINPETNEPIRNDRGLCVKCEPGQPGEIVGKIVNSDPLRRFDGYVDPNATKKKILENVKERGDKYFRSGDILSQDEEGYYYFQDRTGDTFRWKGENVSTQEVEGHLQKMVGMRDVAVYGVEVPNNGGRAGMAAIVGNQDTTDGGLDLVDLRTRISKALPAYACPVFIRIIAEVEVTGTFKLKKVSLARDGFDLAAIGADPLYVALPGQTGYQRLEKGEMYDKLQQGELRL